MNVIILAGGSGTRLWPLSRERYPKQFIRLQGKERSLFQETFLRSVMLADPNDIYTVTNEKYKFLVMGAVEELGIDYRESNILVEPEGKNTLPAIYAGIHEIRDQEDQTVVVYPSDHIIGNSQEFTDVIRASEVLTQEYLITFGVKPDEPNTGYGYISPGMKKQNGYLVDAFKEKPDYETAVSYIEKGYLWNSGIFMFNAALFTGEVRKHADHIYQAFQTSNTIKDAFSKIDHGISIDYGILEKCDKVAVVPVEIGWNDLGSFDAFYDVLDQDENNNIADKADILIDSRNNIIHSEKGKLIAAIGIEDLIVIDNRDALLICKKDRSQAVKDVVERLKERNDPRTEVHVRDYRPWGQYTVLEEEANTFKIKKIILGPGKKLSYQLHHHRSEHWIVVSGFAKIQINEHEQLMRAGESIDLKAGSKHRLENPGKTPLVIIEVQMGEYLKDDDIVRFNDKSENPDR
jgi:mannose-1-phosphate guanylyltransferase / mannose-6-phosphate isomerase